MDYSPRINRRGSADLYSTDLIHGDNNEDNDDEDEDEDEDQEEAMEIPPLLRGLPKEFNFDLLNDEEFTGDFDTMIVKSTRNRSPSSSIGASSSVKRSSRTSSFPIEESDGFSTFVVRSSYRSDHESLSGTVVRRMSGGGGFSPSTMMSMAVESMQAIGDLGGGKQRKVSGSFTHGDDSNRQIRKNSVSSIPESVTREDPTTKYELLNELGESHFTEMWFIFTLECVGELNFELVNRACIMVG
ncbi:hypothetical protein GIB67_009554 [Kingdonia uniflora]|uniref:Uncharacterized protein n=1 Tax=Kingdonia uniflora TaxID=39325 RepID=A0A7J7NWD0_9MAGN|nr:hypothetical protein GIB67_009554 [Kingdonia uniflora]